MHEPEADAWSDVEKQLAKAAFEKAYTREIKALMAEVRVLSNNISEPDELWQLHDFLSARRHEMDGKYDYRYAVLPFIFSTLVKDKWLSLEELDGLATDKLSKITALSRLDIY